MLMHHLLSLCCTLLSVVWWHRAPLCMETPSMPRALSSWKTWSATFSLSISLSRYCQHIAAHRILQYYYMFLYIFTFFFVPILPRLCVMWSQAINKGPSRLPGSTVDIRIPNRLAGSGADMFHIIETQVDANSSLYLYLAQIIIY